MTDPEIRRQAVFDQINASHRDMLAAVKRASAALFQMNASGRQAFMDGLEPIERELLRVVAVELGDHALLTALDEQESI